VPLSATSFGMSGPCMSSVVRAKEEHGRSSNVRGTGMDDWESESSDRSSFVALGWPLARSAQLKSRVPLNRNFLSDYCICLKINRRRWQGTGLTKPNTTLEIQVITQWVIDRAWLQPKSREDCLTQRIGVSGKTRVGRYLMEHGTQWNTTTLK